MDLRFSAKTDVGLSRDHNEDNYLVDRQLGLFMVADGMGGHNAGEVASAMAVNVTRDAIQQASKTLRMYRENPTSDTAREKVRVLLENAVKEACFKIFDQGLNNSAQRGMGTTLTLTLILGTRAFIAHVGDSRVYLSRQGTVHQLTQDHSMVNELIKHGKIKSLKDLDHRFKNAVTRAVGVHESVEVDVLDFDLLPEDRLLLCSDGLHGYMDEASVLRELGGDDLDVIAGNLVQLANRKGGKDNITHVIIEALGSQSDYVNLHMKAATMKGLDVFQFLNFEEMTRVMHLISEKRYRAGEVLFNEGDEDDRFMILLEGEIVLSRGGGELSTLNPGAHFGEMALVSTATRSATAVAGTASVLMEIKRDQFFRLMRGDTSLAIKCMWSLVTTLSNRLRLTTGEVARLSELTGEKPSGPAEMFGVTVPVMGPEEHLPEALKEMTKSSPMAPPPPPPPLPPGVGSS